MEGTPRPGLRKTPPRPPSPVALLGQTPPPTPDRRGVGAGARRRGGGGGRGQGPGPPAAPRGLEPIGRGGRRVGHGAVHGGGRPGGTPALGGGGEGAPVPNQRGPCRTRRRQQTIWHYVALDRVLVVFFEKRVRVWTAVSAPMGCRVSLTRTKNGATHATRCYWGPAFLQFSERRRGTGPLVRWAQPSPP